MTAALADSPTAAQAPSSARGPSAAPRRRPHLMPVPDCEPPIRLIRHDEFLRSTVAVPSYGQALAGARSATPHPPLARAGTEVHRGVAGRSSSSPVMEHRRWTVGAVTAEPQPVASKQEENKRHGPAPHAAAAGSRGTVGTAVGPGPQPGPIPRQIHSAVGAVLRPGVALRPGVTPVNTAPVPFGAATGRPRTFDTAARLAQATIEALAGHRPLFHLQRHFTPGVYEGIQDFPMLGSRNSVRVASLWLCEPAPDVAEVAAAFHCGPRMRALAMQLRAVDGRWMVTAIQMG